MDSLSASEMELEICSLVVKTSSSSILGTVERTTSKTYDSICQERDGGRGRGRRGGREGGAVNFT